MMGQDSQCYKPSHKVIGFSILEKILQGFLNIWLWGPFWHTTQTPPTNSRFPIPVRLHKKLCFDILLAQQFWKRCLKILTGGQTTEPAYTLNWPIRLKAQVSFKKEERKETSPRINVLVAWPLGVFGKWASYLKKKQKQLYLLTIAFSILIIKKVSQNLGSNKWLYPLFQQFSWNLRLS